MPNVTYRQIVHEEPTQKDQQPAPASPPSADTHNRWQWAMAPGVDFLAPTSFKEARASGKWLWFLPVRALDAGWHLVKTAVEAEQLGPAAKVATLSSDFDGDPTRRPVIIYTTNYRDQDDIRRVLNALRSLGVRDALAYKTDEATELGKYGDGTSIYTSPAGTTKAIRRDRQASSAAQRPRTPHIRPTADTVRSNPGRL